MIVVMFLVIAVVGFLWFAGFNVYVEGIIDGYVSSFQTSPVMGFALVGATIFVMWLIRLLGKL